MSLVSLSCIIGYEMCYNKRSLETNLKKIVKNDSRPFGDCKKRLPFYSLTNSLCVNAATVFFYFFFYFFSTFSSSSSISLLHAWQQQLTRFPPCSSSSSSPSLPSPLSHRTSPLLLQILLVLLVLPLKSPITHLVLTNSFFLKPHPSLRPPAPAFPLAAFPNCSLFFFFFFFFLLLHFPINTFLLVHCLAAADAAKAQVGRLCVSPPESALRLRKKDRERERERERER
jgi:hypothetical protein